MDGEASEGRRMGQPNPAKPPDRLRVSFFVRLFSIRKKGSPASQREKKANDLAGWYCGAIWPDSLIVRKDRLWLPAAYCVT